MRIIETGRYKGKTLAECPKEYLVWASKHEKNFAERNQWISRDARFILEEKAQVTTPVGNANWNEWHESLQIIAKAPVITDLSTKGNLYSSKGFQLMR